LEPAHQLEQRRLAAAARTDDRDDLAGDDVQIHPVQRHDVAERLARAGDDHAALHVRRLRHGSLDLGPHRSLRGHYPVQVRRVSAGAWRYLSRACLPAPLFEVALTAYRAA
jgi:hypothetical protein